MKKETYNRITFAIGYGGFYVVLFGASAVIIYLAFSLVKSVFIYYVWR